MNEMKAIVILAGLASMSVLITRRRFIALLSSLLILSAIVLRGVESFRLVGMGLLENLLLLSFCFFIVSYIKGIDKLAGKLLLLLGAAVCFLMAWMSDDFYAIPGLHAVFNSPFYFIHLVLLYFGYACLSYQVFNSFERHKISFSFPIAIILTALLIGSLWSFYSLGFAWNWRPTEVWILITSLSAIMAEHSQSKKTSVIALFPMLFSVIGLPFVFP